MLLLMGLPECGKSTFFSRREDLGWEIPIQDALVSRNECIRKIFDLLNSGLSAIEERVNNLIDLRMKFMNLAKSSGFETAYLVFNFPIPYCIQRAQPRTYHPTIVSYDAERFVHNFAQHWQYPIVDTKNFNYIV